MERALEHKGLNTQATTLRKALATMTGGEAPVFQSPSMKTVVRDLEKVAPSDVAILITGESGTGKEVIADLIHALSFRSKGPLIKINCAALPRELIESELFGSVKGAFTGANVDREGLFKQAEGGTLLLDEISEMPVDTQSKLLRVLQEKEVRPVGGRTSYKSDCRVIAATNRETAEAIKMGKLREDLYYRICAISVHLPPLRERREDILPLANAFLKRYGSQAGREMTGFTPEAADALRAFDWPGNVRQLQNEIQRAVLMCEAQLGGRARPVHHHRHEPKGQPRPHLDGSHGTQRHHPDAQGNRRQQTGNRQAPGHRPPDPLQQNQNLQRRILTGQAVTFRRAPKVTVTREGDDFANQIFS